MNNPDASTLLYSRHGPKWRIDVHRAEDVFDPLAFTVFLTGYVAPDFHRSRYMELELFQTFVAGVEHARKVLPRIVGRLKPEDTPDYPNAIGSTVAQGPAFNVEIALSRRVGGSLEKMVAVYDTDDDAAPMLVATDDEIDELCRDCSEVLAHFGIDQAAG